MWVDSVGQVVQGGAQAERQRGLADKLPSMRPNDVDAENLVGVVPGHNLHETVGLTGGLRTTTRREREAADPDRNPELARLFLPEADAGDLGVSEDDRGHPAVVEGLGFPPDSFGGRYALMGCGMR